MCPNVSGTLLAFVFFGPAEKLPLPGRKGLPTAGRAEQGPSPFFWWFQGPEGGTGLGGGTCPLAPPRRISDTTCVCPSCFTPVAHPDFVPDAGKPEKTPRGGRPPDPKVRSLRGCLSASPRDRNARSRSGVLARPRSMSGARLHTRNLLLPHPHAWWARQLDVDGEQAFGPAPASVSWDPAGAAAGESGWPVSFRVPVPHQAAPGEDG